VKRFAGVRYHGVLDETGRNAATRSLRSAGAEPTSWTSGAGYTYASVLLGSECDVERIVAEGGRVDCPPLVVLRIRPDAGRRLAALESALGGPGRPAGVLEARPDGGALIVEFDARRTPLDVVVALVDAELASAPGRTIEPLVTLDDRTLTGFASSLLNETALDPSRLIETHLEPLLAAGAPEPAAR
jgi:hypothetical protein